MLKLSDKWAEILSNQGETGMGYQVITVNLKDGRIFKQTVHQEGYITEIKGYRDIPFSEEDIEDIVITHDKWNFNAERNKSH